MGPALQTRSRSAACRRCPLICRHSYSNSFGSASSWAFWLRPPALAGASRTTATRITTSSNSIPRKMPPPTLHKVQTYRAPFYLRRIHRLCRGKTTRPCPRLNRCLCRMIRQSRPCRTTLRTLSLKVQRPSRSLEFALRGRNPLDGATARNGLAQRARKPLEETFSDVMRHLSVLERHVKVHAGARGNGFKEMFQQ